MLILVTGGNGSGKSRFAESVAAGFGGTKYYAATMIPYGPDGEARKQKHIAQRAGLGFVTVECPFALGAVAAYKDDLVLLEDVSNLLANTMFDVEHFLPPAAVEADIIALEGRCKVLIAVTALPNARRRLSNFVTERRASSKEKFHGRFKIALRSAVDLHGAADAAV